MRVPLVILTSAIAFAAWSCGGGSGGSPTGPSSSSPSSASSITILGQRGAQSFSPNPASVPQGGMVSWNNTDTTTHHIVMDDGSIDAGNIAPGTASPSMQMKSASGTYHCIIHPTMVGSINTATTNPPPGGTPY